VNDSVKKAVGGRKRACREDAANKVTNINSVEESNWLKHELSGEGDR